MSTPEDYFGRKGLVQSLMRSMDIMELLSAAESGLSMQEICKALGIKQPTAYNLVRTLMTRGYVIKTSPPVRYHLGGAITRLYEQRLQHDVVRRASEVILNCFQEILTMLPKRTSIEQDASISYAQPSGDELRMLMRVRSYRPRIVEMLPDFYFGAYETTSAIAYQAFCSAEERLAYRQRHPITEVTLRRWKSEQKLNAHLEMTRERGYALLPGLGEDQFRVSVPVFNDRKRLLGVAGLGVFGFTLTKQTIDAYIQLMQNAAKDIAAI